jgi:hypothetical protein
MVAKVVSKNEISINDVFYPTDGPIRRVLQSQVPRITIGDPISADEPRASRVSQRNVLGGIGKERGLDSSSSDRVWWSELNLDHANHMLLPAKDNSTANSATGAGPGVIGELDDAIYADFNGSIEEYNNSANSWTAREVITSGGAATNVVTLNLDGTVYIVFCNGTKVNHSANGTAFTEVSQAWKYMAAWNQRLYGIKDDGTLGYTEDLSTFTDLAQLPVPDSYISKLIVYDLANGGDALYAVTKVGLFSYDSLNDRWIKTSAEWAYHPTGGQASVVHQGSLYMSVGLTIYKYTITGGGASLTTMGPNQDDGLPTEYLGEITTLATGPGETGELLASVAVPVPGITSAQNAGAGTNRASGTRLWRNPENIAGAGFSTCFSLTTGQTTQYLQADQFGHAIPAAAVPVGIAVSITRQAYGFVGSPSVGTVQDLDLKLLDEDGAAHGSNLAATSQTWFSSPNLLFGSFETVTYGGPDTKWGLAFSNDAGGAAITPTILNDADQGVELQARNNGSGPKTDALAVESITQTVYFTTTGHAVMLGHNGLGWQVRRKGAVTDAAIVSIHTSYQYSKYRVWYLRSGEQKAHYMAAQVTAGNPSQITTYEYDITTADHITTWFDADDVKNAKVARSLYIQTSHLNANVTVTCYYAVDYSEAWTAFGSPLASDAVHNLPFPDPTVSTKQKGQVFDSIRFKFVCVSNDDLISPDINAVEFRFRTKIPPTYGYQVRIPFSSEAVVLKGYKGKTARELMENLIAVVENNEMVEVVWRPNAAGSEFDVVDVTNLDMAEETGETYRGVATVSIASL